MILGQPRTDGFTRPAGANPNFQPKLPHTGFFTNIHPFAKVTRRMASASGFYMPGLPGPMGPVPLPSVPAPAPVAPVGPPIPKAGGTAGFGDASGFGSTGGVRAHMHVNPYRVMRGGYFPGIMNNGSNIRAGVRMAASRVHSSMPFQTRELSPLPLPPAVMPATPVPGQTKGLFGALFGRSHRRSFFSPFAPAMAQQQCERIGPRGDGLYVTICNGRVTQVSDAAGNVHNDPFSSY